MPHKQRRKKATAPATAPPTPRPPNPAQVQLQPATPISVPQSEGPSTPHWHGVGTQLHPITVSPDTVALDHSTGTRSRPITVSSNSPVLLNPYESIPVVRKSVKFQSRSGKDNQKAPEGASNVILGMLPTGVGAKKRKEDVVIISSDSEDSDAPKRPHAKPRCASPPVPVIGRRRRVVIIEDDGEEVVQIADGSNPNKRIRRYRIAVHTVQMKTPNRTEKPPTPKQSTHNTAVPLAVQLFDIAADASEAGATGPNSGTTSIHALEPSHSNPAQALNHTKKTEPEDDEYEFSDIEPEVIAALCDGM